MASVNKVILVGNLGRDPELRVTASGSAGATLNLATTEKFKGRNGDQQEQTEWHRVVIFGKQAEVAQNYLSKGASVYIEGRLQARQWKDQSGQTRYTTEIVCDRMQMLGGGKGQGITPAQVQNTSQTDDDWDVPWDDNPVGWAASTNSNGKPPF